MTRTAHLPELRAARLPASVAVGPAPRREWPRRRRSSRPSSSSCSSSWPPSAAAPAAAGPYVNPSPAEIRALLNDAAVAHDIPPKILYGIAYQESTWRQFDRRRRPAHRRRRQGHRHHAGHDHPSRRGRRAPQDRHRLQHRGRDGHPRRRSGATRRRCSPSSATATRAATRTGSSRCGRTTAGPRTTRTRTRLGAHRRRPRPLDRGRGDAGPQGVAGQRASAQGGRSSPPRSRSTGGAPHRCPSRS